MLWHEVQQSVTQHLEVHSVVRIFTIFDMPSTQRADFALVRTMRCYQLSRRLRGIATGRRQSVRAGTAGLVSKSQ